MEEVAKRLMEKFDVTIVTARLRRSFARHSSLDDVSVVRVGFGFFIDKWLFPFLAPFAVWKLRPDVVHAVLETFAGAALWGCRWLVPSAKRILTLQTTNRSFLKCPIIRAAHKVTAISSVLVAAAKQCGREAVLIPNGVDYRAIREACMRYPKVPGRILFVGRLEKMKGVDVLLTAFAAARHKLRDTNIARSSKLEALHVVGSGSRLPALERLARKLGLLDCVVFLGKLDGIDLLREYAEAEIFCALPRSEAMGNVFLEAQAAGCAVIGARVGGVPDIVLHGKTGILVSPDDPVVAANVLMMLLTDLARRAQMASAAVAHAAQYDWSGIAEKYEKVYQALMPSALGRCWQP